MTPRLSAYFVIVLTFLLPIFYNVIAIKIFGPEGMISFVLYEDAHRFPVIAAFFGVVFGGLLAHWFWPVYPSY